MFGFASAIADQLQFSNLPANLVLMMSYISTVVGLLGRPVVAAWRSRCNAHERREPSIILPGAAQ